MSKVADVKLRWSRSVSPDVVKVKAVTTINGATTELELGPDVEELMVEVAAISGFAFRIDSFDDEDNVAASETYTFTLGDLTAPQPATGLFHEVIGIRDVPDPAPTPSA